VNVRTDLVIVNEVAAHVVRRWMGEMEHPVVFDGTRIAVVADHYSPSNDVRASELLRRMRQWAAEQGTLLYDEGRGGIEHPLVAEQGLVGP
jgi:3-isopropylmalate/(R)-2-methylmalate dehydratase large subunit